MYKLKLNQKEYDALYYFLQRSKEWNQSNDNPVQTYGMVVESMTSIRRKLENMPMK